MTGAGTPTPTTPGFSWTLSGVGWTFVGAVDGASVNVTSAPDAAIGNLSVVASLAVPGGTLVTPPSSVELVATTTSISTASLNRTEVDIGQSIGVAVEAVAAAGYDYSATLFPGLGDPAMAVPCTSGPGAGGTASVDCAATFDFDAVGVAQPVVTVTNGVSASTWAFPEVTVHPAPWVAFLPGTPVGYANVTVPITVSAGTETGTAPFERACLEGNGRLTCEGSPGPTWTFNAFYPTPGHYTITAWIVDATGTNRSASTTVSVVSPLEVALVGDPASATAGVPVSLGAVVTGGALPARLWWNTTGSEAPLASGWVTSDGPVGATLVPSSVGFLTISVAVVDGLGTTVTAAETLTVGPGAATLVAPAATPTTSAASAGSSTAIEWVALDAAGIVVPSFSSLAEIELALPGSTATASGWLNASGVGPLASPLPGWFSVPASAWIDGALNVSVTSRTAGPVAVELSLASAVPTADDPVHLEVAPDVDHLRLFDPVTALAGGPANDTLWQVTDRFGNPAYGASVVTTAAFGGSSEETIAPVLAEPDGATEVWVNWSAPGGVAGTVVVTDLAGTELLPPVRVAGPAGPWSAFVPDLLVPIVIGAAAVVGAGLVLRPRRRRSAVLVASVEDAAWLQRLAEGRASVVETVRRHGPVDLAGLASVWEPPPAPPDLADWVASLLTDGTLDARFEDGRGRPVLPLPRGGARRPRDDRRPRVRPRRGAPGGRAGRVGRRRSLGRLATDEVVVAVGGFAGAEAVPQRREPRLEFRDPSGRPPPGRRSCGGGRRTARRSASISFSRIPTRVTSGVPRRTPPGCFGLLSPGRRFLLEMIAASASRLRDRGSPPPSRSTRTAIVWERVNPRSGARTSNPWSWSAAARARGVRDRPGGRSPGRTRGARRGSP